MNKTQVALAASAVAITVLGVKLYNRNRQFEKLRRAAIKLDEWSDIAQAVIKDHWSNHPELIGELSEETRMQIDFYNIIVKENLF